MILVFDLGGSTMRVALAEKGKLGDIVRVPTDRGKDGFAAFVEVLHSTVKGHKIEAIGGGFPGQLAGENGEIVVATNLPEWYGLEMVAELRSEFGVPVQVSNDVEMCGLGEAKFGAGITSGVMAYYTVSTGVNAVRIVDGEVDVTVSRYELGKQIVGNVNGEPQALEPLIGGAALEKRTGKAPRDIHDPEVWRELERSLAVGIYNTALYWNPELIVLGGSMMRDIELERVAKNLHAMPNVFESWPQLAGAKLGDEAGILGAQAALEQRGFK